MDYETAKNLMDQITIISRSLAELSESVDKISEPDRSKLMQGVGKTMGELYLELIYPIGMQYPDLNPVNKHKIPPAS
jgi:hypothetical protein